LQEVASKPYEHPSLQGATSSMILPMVGKI